MRWHRREAALRNVIARWREPAIMRRVLPDSARDGLREQCARVDDDRLHRIALELTFRTNSEPW